MEVGRSLGADRKVRRDWYGALKRHSDSSFGIPMFEWISNTMNSLGAVGVGMLMLLENFIPPLPSEFIMPLAGFLSQHDGIGFWNVVIAGAVGSLLGAVGWYWVGRSTDERRFRSWVEEHGRWLTLNCDDLDRAMDWFARRGGATLVIGRLIPGVRTFVSIPAGFAGTPFVPFLLYSAAGTVLWTGALAFAGRMLGSQYDKVSAYLEPVSWIGLAAIVAWYLYRVMRWKPTGTVRRAAVAESSEP